MLLMHAKTAFVMKRMILLYNNNNNKIVSITYNVEPVAPTYVCDLVGT